jgi:hypothetical protein
MVVMKRCVRLQFDAFVSIFRKLTEEKNVGKIAAKENII